MDTMEKEKRKMEFHPSDEAYRLVLRLTGNENKAARVRNAHRELWVWEGDSWAWNYGRFIQQGKTVF